VVISLNASCIGGHNFENEAQIGGYFVVKYANLKIIDNVTRRRFSVRFFCLLTATLENIDIM
jgi:hypothetical protein